MLENIKGAIFDLDGTLVDSLWVWEKIDRDFFKNHNIKMPKNFKNEIEHLGFEEVAVYFKKRFSLNISIEEILKEWSDGAYYEYSTNVRLKPGVKEFLSLLKASGIKIALATSNSHLLLEAVLKNNDIIQYFDCITTTGEVARGKDCPDVYLLAAEKLNLSPKNCVVFEDILPAVLGAKSAGMKVIGVHDIYSEDQRQDIINHADKFIYDYNELTTAV